MKNNCIILFIKAPETGFVKTRLAKDVGNKKACEIYKYLAEKTIEQIKTTDADFEIHFFPEKSIGTIKTWLVKDYEFYPQTGNDLGDKMKNAFMHVFEKGYQKIILAGSDIPELTTRIFESAFQHIQGNPVLGPCEDGGYYLIGMDRTSFDASFFQNISWSTETVLKETVKQMKEKGFDPYFLPLLNDIDTVADLRQSKVPAFQVDYG